MTNLILYLILYLTSISSIFDPLFDPILDPFFIHYFIHYFIQIVEKRDILFELFVDYYLVIIRWIIWSINYRSMLNSIIWLKSFKWWTFYLSWLTMIWLLFDDIPSIELFDSFIDYLNIDWSFLSNSLYCCFNTHKTLFTGKGIASPRPPEHLHQRDGTSIQRWHSGEVAPCGLKKLAQEAWSLASHW